MPALPNQKGGVGPLPMPGRIPTPNMTGIGKPPPPTTSKNVGVREKDARSRIYRNIGTRRNA